MYVNHDDDVSIRLSVTDLRSNSRVSALDVIILKTTPVIETLQSQVTSSLEPL